MDSDADVRFRLFLGLWPPPGTLAALELQAAAWQWPATARRTTAEKLHLTLHFLGNVALRDVAALQDALQRVHWPGALLQLDWPQVWPGGIAVLEAREVPSALARLHARLGAALAGLGMDVEQRRYRPHVTFARKAQGARPPRDAAPIAWQAQPRFVLARSLPGGRGYQQLHAFG